MVGASLRRLISPFRPCMPGMLRSSRTRSRSSCSSVRARALSRSAVSRISLSGRPSRMTLWMASRNSGWSSAIRILYKAVHLFVVVMVGTFSGSLGAVQRLRRCRIQGQAGLFPAIYAIAVPVEPRIAQGVRPPGGVPAEPAIGAAVEYQRAIALPLADASQVLGEVIGPLRLQRPITGIGQPDAAGQVGMRLGFDEAAGQPLATVDVHQHQLRFFIQQCA